MTVLCAARDLTEYLGRPALAVGPVVVCHDGTALQVYTPSDVEAYLLGDTSVIPPAPLIQRQELEDRLQLLSRWTQPEPWYPW